MGIPRIIPFLKKRAPESYYQVELDSFKGHRFAIDGTLLLYKYWYTRPTEEFVLYKTKECAKLLRHHDIQATFVFDGMVKSKHKAFAHIKRHEYRCQTKYKLEQSLLIQKIMKKEASPERIAKALLSVLSKKSLPSPLLRDTDTFSPKSAHTLLNEEEEEEEEEEEKEEKDDDEERATLSLEDILRSYETPDATPLLSSDPHCAFAALKAQIQSMSNRRKSNLQQILLKYDPTLSEDVCSALDTEVRRLDRHSRTPPKHLLTKLRWELLHQGVPSILTPECCEAEQVCGALVGSGLADVVVSDDTDAMVFYPVPVLRQWTQNTLFLVDPRFVLDLELTYAMFKEMCVLSGSDFTDKIHGLGPVKAFKLIQKYGSIKNILQYCPELVVPDKFDPVGALKVFNNHYLDIEDVKKQYFQAKEGKLLDDNNMPLAHVDTSLSLNSEGLDSQSKHFTVSRDSIPDPKSTSPNRINFSSFGLKSTFNEIRNWDIKVK